MMLFMRLLYATWCVYTYVTHFICNLLFVMLHNHLRQVFFIVPSIWLVIDVLWVLFICTIFGLLYAPLHTLYATLQTLYATLQTLQYTVQCTSVHWRILFVPVFSWYRTDLTLTLFLHLWGTLCLPDFLYLYLWHMLYAPMTHFSLLK